MDPGRGRQARNTRGNRTLVRGRKAEELARRHLQDRGLKLLTANYRCRYGELDLVMRDGAFLVVVEVRSRRSDRHGTPEASIDYRKRGRILRSARCFLRDHPQFGGMMLRFDVVGILTGGESARIRWTPNALEFDGR